MQLAPWAPKPHISTIHYHIYWEQGGWWGGSGCCKGTQTAIATGERVDSNRNRGKIRRKDKEEKEEEEMEEK